MGRIAFALALCCCCGGLAGQVERELRLPLREGKVSALALSRALLEEYGFRGDTVSFPDVWIDVRGTRGRLLLRGIEKALRGTVDFAESAAGGEFLVRIDHAQARLLRHRVKRRLGRALSAMVGRDVLARRYELVLPDGLRPDETFVLCVHGVDSSPAKFDDLRPFLASRAGVRSGFFAYANDEAVDRIGRQLSRKLKELQSAFPERRVILITHSMGGLVARYMLETASLDPGNVTMLIMVGVPNQGSRLARLRPGKDALEFLAAHGDEPRLLGPFLDGLGEAGWDLWPDSPFLAALNAKPRNAAVRYRSILGDKGIVSPEQMLALKSSIMTRVQRMEKHEVYSGKVRSWLDDVEEIVDGQGDGAVSVRRGRLAGVETVVVHLDHDGLFRAVPDRGEQPVFAQLRRWVEAGLRPQK